MNAIRQAGLLVVLVALFVALSTPGFTRPPAQENPKAFEEARKKFLDVRDGHGLSALHNAALWNRLDYARYLIKKGADVNTREAKHLWTPLHLTVYFDRLEMAELLVNGGADINARSRSGTTPLHMACDYKKPEMAEVLILLGADLEAATRDKYTPLHYAACRGHAKIARLLIKFGAAVDSRDLWKQTPLHLACSRGHYEVAEVLLAAGADINARCNVGSTPLNQAIAGNRGDVEELLRLNGAEEGTAWARKHFQPGATRWYTVKFESSPAGARVEVNGKLACKKAPCLRYLKPGEYRVTMQRPWNYYRAGRMQVEDDRKLKWNLERRPPQVGVLIITDEKVQLYDRAVRGFISAYRGFAEIGRLDGGPNGLGRSVEKLQARSPGIILTVGLETSKWVTRHIHNIPVIFCMSLSPLHNKLKTPVSTGVALDAPPNEQLRAFQQAIPGLRRVGIVYDPRRTGSFVLDAYLAARRLGLRIVGRQVSGESEVPAAMREIAGRVDALWMIRDATTVTRSTFNQAIRLQSQHKIPLLTYSEVFVLQGAFASFSADYYEQGGLVAKIAMSIEDGAYLRDIPVQHPKASLTINLDTAEKLSSKFKVPPSLLLRSDVRKHKESWGLEKDLAGENH